MKKLERFIASLTDEEINSQLNDIFGWAKAYQELLEREKHYRHNIMQKNMRNRHYDFSDSANETICETFEDEFPQNDTFFEYELELIEKPVGFSDVNGWADEIKRLSSEEIFQRYQNETDWTVEYRYLCYAELLKRQESVKKHYSETYNSDVSIDYRIAQQLQGSVSNLSLEQTRERLSKLQQISEYSLTNEEIAKLRFEIETCELHIYELMSNEGLLCPQCGSEVEKGTVFCPQCGEKL